MNAILTKKGAKRIGAPYLAGKTVRIIDIRTWPHGRTATVIVGGKVLASGVQLYTPGMGKNCGLIEVRS